ncbi:MAG: protein jag [Dehalococcoidia bacterium]|nr:protein jag [Dehalococcoidia bacterium]
MEPLEISAKNVDEAVNLALSKLGLSRSEVTIEVLQEGKSGIFRWGGEDAKVRVTPLISADDEIIEESESPVEISALADVAREATEKLLSLMDVPATVEVTGEGNDQSPMVIEISDGDLGILIGRRGQSLMALQYIVNFMVSRKFESNARVTIDVGGYRKRRQKELEALALRVADVVSSSKRPITLEAMPASERRIIHITLKDTPAVTTGSIGFGDNRKVVVSPE